MFIVILALLSGKIPIRRIPLSNLRSSTDQRPLKQDHIADLIKAHIGGSFALHHSTIYVINSSHSTILYDIIDGQHRWAALKRINERLPVNDQTSTAALELNSMDCIVVPSTFTIEQQRIVANITDGLTTVHLHFSNVDLVIIVRLI